MKKKILLSLAVTLVTLGTLELLSFFYIRIIYKSSLNDLYSNVISVFDDGKCLWGDQMTIHPYLALKYRQTPPCNHPFANARGMVGDDIPWELDTKNYNILLLGGSVAEALYLSRSLENYLNRFYKFKKGTIKIWNGSISAGQQPRQAIVHLMHGGQFQAVVSLEGFNEHFNFMSRFPFETPPSSWFFFSKLVNENRQQVSSIRDAFSSWANRTLRDMAYTPLRHSHFLHLFFYTGASLSRPDSMPEVLSPVIQFEYADFFDYYTDSYADILKSMSAIAKQRKQRFYVFFQPAPALYKPLTKREIKVVGNLEYGPIYENIVKTVSRKIKNNVMASSLLDTFKDNSSELYIDLIHFSYKSLGNEIIAEKMSRLISKDLQKKMK